MVKLTGDFHSVYYRTKDSLNDINKIMRTSLPIESVLQKPNHLVLKLFHNLNFKEQAQLKKIVGKKYNLSKVYKDGGCRTRDSLNDDHKINLWYKTNNRVGNRRAIFAKEVLDKNLTIYLPEDVKSTEGGYPEVGFHTVLGKGQMSTKDCRASVDWFNDLVDAKNRIVTDLNDVHKADVVWVESHGVDMIQRQYGRYHDKEGQKIPASEHNSYENFLKGKWRKTESDGKTFGIYGEFGNELLTMQMNINDDNSGFQPYPYDAVLRYSNAYHVGHFQELGFPTCDSDGDYAYKSGYSSVDEKHMDYYPRNMEKYPSSEDDVMITFDTTDPMAKIALNSKDMLLKLHKIIGSKYGEKNESIRFGYDWEQNNGECDWTYTPNHTTTKQRMRFYLRNNVGLNQMEEAQKLFGKKWEIEECNAGGCCKDTNWCLVVNRKGDWWKPKRGNEWS